MQTVKTRTPDATAVYIGSAGDIILFTTPLLVMPHSFLLQGRKVALFDRHKTLMRVEYMLGDDAADVLHTEGRLIVAEVDALGPLRTTKNLERLAT
jgi:hypothetical protein